MCPNHDAVRAAVDEKWQIHDRAEDLIRQHIDEFGWHVVLIEAEDDLPPFAFSIGLHRTFQHPEIIMFGMSPRQLHAFINECGHQIKAGKRMPTDQHVHDILEGYPCVFKNVPRDQYYDHVGYARWYYEGDDFPLIQLVWPDRDGRFPWDPAASESFRHRQPALATRGGAVKPHSF